MKIKGYPALLRCARNCKSLRCRGRDFRWGSARAQAGHQLLDVRPQASERSILRSNASEGHKNPCRKDGLCSSAE